MLFIGKTILFLTTYQGLKVQLMCWLKECLIFDKLKKEYESVFGRGQAQIYSYCLLWTIYDALIYVVHLIDNWLITARETL